MRIRKLYPLFALLLLSASLPAQSWRTVTRVVDGDTIVLDGDEKIRLIGVDTPETVDPRKPVQYFGQEASDFTRRVVQGKRVRLEYDWQRTDKYGRTLAYIYLEGGTFLNAEIVKQGYGHAYTQYPFKYLEDFRKYEREAREAGRGLWADNVAVPGASAAVTPAPALPPASVDPMHREQTATETVYATRTGAKYHRAGCRYLARSQIPMSLKDAAARYGPCSVCRPPVLATSSPAAERQVETPKERKESSYSAPAVSSGRCQAITKKGTQCSRRAQAGRAYCWQH